MNEAYFDEGVRIDGRDFRVRKSYDRDSSAPWIECDGHGPIREVNRRHDGNGHRGNKGKAPGEVLLDNGRGDHWAYDFAEAVKIAKRDGGGSKPYVIEGETKGQKAVRAVQADMKFCQDWLNNDWWWCTCSVAFESDFQWSGENCEWDYLGGVEDSHSGLMSHYADPEQPSNVWVGQMIPNLTHDRRKAWREALKQARANRAFAQANRMLECTT